MPGCSQLPASKCGLSTPRSISANSRPTSPGSNGAKSCAGNRRQRLTDAAENRRLHQLKRHRRRYMENFPLVLGVFQQVSVIRIQALLLLAAQHQHRRTGDDQRPQRLQFFTSATA